MSIEAGLVVLVAGFVAVWLIFVVTARQRSPATGAARRSRRRMGTMPVLDAVLIVHMTALVAIGLIGALDVKGEQLYLVAERGSERGCWE